jgi:adenosine kinase
MKILLTGSVAFDYLMTFPGQFRDHILPEHLETISLSFLVDSMVRWQGGVAPNIAYTLALLGGSPYLWAAVGEDFGEYRAWLEARGVDTSGARQIPGVFTASYFCNTDQVNNQIASFFPGAMAHAAELSLADLQGPAPDLVVISPNDPAAMQKLIAECRQLGWPYVYDPSQQIVRMSAAELQAGIEGADSLFVNDYEAALIENLTGLTPAAIAQTARFVVVTRGAEGADIYTRDASYHVPVAPPTQIVDPIGVGDAFRGGFLAGLDLGFDLLRCGQMGALAATFCLEQPGGQGQAYTPAEFVARFRQYFDDNHQLDLLLARAAA